MVLLVREFLLGFDYRTGYLLLGFRIPYMLWQFVCAFWGFI